MGGLQQPLDHALLWKQHLLIAASWLAVLTNARAPQAATFRTVLKTCLGGELLDPRKGLHKDPDLPNSDIGGKLHHSNSFA